MDQAIVNEDTVAVNPLGVGTKAAAHYPLTVWPGETVQIRLRLTRADFSVTGELPFGRAFSAVFDSRIREANQFYATVIPEDLSPDAKNVMRQSLAGMLWSKQFYHYEVNSWLEG